MAWFKRNHDEAPDGHEGTPDAVAPEPAAETPPAPAAEPAAGAPAWTTAAPMPSVVPRIQRILAGDARSSTTLGRPSPLSLAPLGHAVTADAPTGVVSALALADHGPGHGGAPTAADQPPLEYLQRAPDGAASPRPAAPAQLLVPSFQPTGLPAVPVAAPEVQRSPASPSFTRAPSPGPALVLPVGEVLSPPAAPRAPDAPAPPAPVDAPLLAEPSAPLTGPAVAAHEAQRAPDVELPLAPVQRHADHPGHVDGDEAPVEAADVQRAPVEAPPAAAPPQAAPLLAEAPLAPAAPLTAPDAHEPAASATAAAPSAPEVDLPLAPVQRHADHPGHVDGDEAPAEAADVQRAAVDAPAAATPVSAPLVGDAAPLATQPAAPAATPDVPAVAAPDLPLPGSPVQRSAAPRRPAGLGAPISSVPPGAGHPGAVPRAPLPAPPAPPTATAPLVGTGPLQPPSLPLAAVQRAATQDGELTDDAGAAPAEEGGPSLDFAQRAPIDAGTAPSAAGPATPEGAATGAPLVGEAPLESTIATPDAVAPAGETPAATAAGPELELVQRAPVGGAPGPAGSAATSAATATAPSASASSSSATTPAAAPLPPLIVAPLLGGRPFSTVQRAADAAPSASAGLIDRSSPEVLSPEPGRVYQPLAGIGMWNGAPPPDLPGPAIEAAPSHVAAAVQRATGTDVSNVRIRRDTGVTAQRLAARAFTHEGEVHIPASVGSLESGEGASLATHELVHAGQQSVLGSSRPHEHTPEGQHLEAQARSAEHASLAGLELPKMPLAAPAAPAVQRAPVENGGASPFTPRQLSRLIDLAESPPPGGPSIQRVETDLAPSPPPRPDTPAPDLPPAAPGAPAQQTPQELEELATKLFPTLRNLFRGELLGFRRRSGTSADRPLS